MNYSLTPFPDQPSSETPFELRERFPDIRESLAPRPKPDHAQAIGNSALLDLIVETLLDVTVPFFITHCHEANGDLHLSVTAAGGGHQVSAGDELRGGLFIRNSESCRFETLICTRLYRVICENGALMECDKEQAFAIPITDAPPADWQLKVSQVIQHSFDEQYLQFDFQRFQATTNEMIVTPYEFLCHLEAQRLINEDEQSEILAAFNDNADFTMYGLINAVTQTAHEHRASDRWLRAFEIERLAGEILRGDHHLPAFDFAYS
ncbi:hypothetical protein Pan241w_48430 [Gimesia alba]|uniref:Uncharacterized protein n=1 Tax=Gimesia alba TaxID=2527973 RepID=A0A517RLH8_9PLAN|nr:hypothetical protein [Gimesia alba]QDT44727.1 hypothetical protein Pan241w_48430 [Gimesia alba]